jgi:hypothetical protein
VSNAVHVEAPSAAPSITVQSGGWSELWLKEDWWAIWLGLGIVLAGYAFYANGSTIKWIAVTSAKWTTFAQLGASFSKDISRYLAQFVLWLVIFGIALSALGHKPKEFLPAFIFLYLLSVLIFALGQWTQANYYNLATASRCAVARPVHLERYRAAALA